MRRTGARWSWLLVPSFLVVAVEVLPAQSPTEDRAIEASIRHVRQAVVPQRNGADLVALFSLRQLRDASLRPFFYQLAQRGDPLVRVHAILGLGEISETGQVDPWLITQLQSPQARYTVIANALEMGLLDTDHVNQMLAGDELEARPRVVLLAYLISQHEPVDRQALARLAASGNLSVAGLAACLRAQIGDDDDLTGYRQRLDALTRSDRNRHLVDLLQAIGDYRLTGALDLAEKVLAVPDADAEVVLTALNTMLALDPPTGVTLFNRHLAVDTSYSRKVRYALLLLEAGRGVPASAYDRLPADDQLLGHMARAGRAISTGADASRPLIDLLSLGHYRASRWVIDAAGELHTAQATLVYEYLIDAIEGDRRGRDERAELAMIAAARLFEINPQAVTDRLVAAEDDSLTQQAILLGLFDSRAPAAGEAARRVKRIGYGRADSMALILIAKHTDRLSEKELQDLGVIASGGRVSAVLQAQAGWLYLKHAGRLEHTLAVIFADP